MPSRKRQSKLDFSATPKPLPRPRRAIPQDSESDVDDDADLDRPLKRRRMDDSRHMPASQGPHGVFGQKDDIETLSEDSNVERPEPLLQSPEDRCRERRRRKKEKERAVDSEDEYEFVRRKTLPRRGRAALPVQPTDEEDEDEHEDELQRPIVRKSRRIKKPVDSSMEDDGEDDEEDERPRATRNRHRRSRRASPEAADGEEEDGGSADYQNMEETEDDELKEDLAFLRSSPLPDRGRLRSTQDRPKSDREKALEALKKKRGMTSEPSSSATPSRKKPIVIESGSESDLDIIPEEQDDDFDGIEDDGSEEDDEGDAATSAREIFQEGADDESFIDDHGADAALGVPADMDMPLEFMRISSAKPRELFKFVVQSMVMKKINPSFSPDEQVYVLAFRKLNDEVNGLAQSKFHSSAWTADFTRAIRARPELVINEMRGARALGDAHCEACNRRGHTATWEASLTGKPYDKQTLDPLIDDDDSDADSDASSSSALSSNASEEVRLNGEKATYDAQGERLPPESHLFALGSTCKANAQVAHTLYHWRYHLNTWVVDYLVLRGHCTPEKLVKRDKWSARKREKYALKIVDEMMENGAVRRLHRLYKDQVEFAVGAKNEFERGWGRSRAGRGM